MKQLFDFGLILVIFISVILIFGNAQHTPECLMIIKPFLYAGRC